MARGLLHARGAHLGDTYGDSPIRHLPASLLLRQLLLLLLFIAGEGALLLLLLLLLRPFLLFFTPHRRLRTELAGASAVLHLRLLPMQKAHEHQRGTRRWGAHLSSRRQLGVLQRKRSHTVRTARTQDLGLARPSNHD